MAQVVMRALQKYAVDTADDFYLAVAMFKAT